MNFNKTRGITVRSVPNISGNASGGISNNNWVRNMPSGIAVSNKNANNWIKNAPTVVGQNFKPWFKTLVNINRPVIRSKNNISAVINSARARAGLELYSRFKGFYINAHGFCTLNSKKFTIPKDKAVLFVGQSGELVNNAKARNLERTLLRNNGRIKSFISGTSSILKHLKYGNHKGRLYLPGEQIYEHTMHLTRSKNTFITSNNWKNTNINNENLLKLASIEHSQIGPSFGHIWRLPLQPGYSSQNPFTFTFNKNKILWNLPTLLSRSPNAKNNGERYRMRRQLQKLSTILREGPPGVYIVGTCRQDVIINNNANINNNSSVMNYQNLLKMERGGSQVQINNSARKFFTNVKKQNTTNASYVPGIRNTSALRASPY